MLIFRFVIFSGHDRFSGEASDTEEVQQENDVIAEHNDDKANNNAGTGLSYSRWCGGQSKVILDD